MKLGEASHNLYRAADALSELRLAIESLSFCVNVFREYDSGKREPNEHMDPAKAKAQLLEAIERVVHPNRD